jgi:hypothetical protein
MYYIVHGSAVISFMLLQIVGIHGLIILLSVKVDEYVEFVTGLNI